MLTHLILIFVRTPVALTIALAAFIATVILGAWSVWL